MLLKNEFEIDANLDQAWTLLTDLERIAPCMPGASLDGREGEKYLGNVKIKLGPVGANFVGSAHFAHKDDAAHTAIITAAGKDPKGHSTANAKIQARLEEVSPTRTRVLIDTDLDISGRMAQFGRGAIADVSSRLIRQFVTNLSSLLSSPSTLTETSNTQGPHPAEPTPQATPASTPAAAPSEPGMDVLALAAPIVKERYGQAITGGLIGFILSWLVFGRKVGRCANASRD